MDAEGTLRKVRLFQDLPGKQLSTLAKWATTREFPAGHVIVHEGQMGMGLYCIETGKVKVTRQTGRGEEELGVLGPGDSFGEISLLDDGPRTATVTAVEPTTAVMLDKVQFLSELHAFPEIALSILPALISWLRAADARVAELT